MKFVMGASGGARECGCAAEPQKVSLWVIRYDGRNGPTEALIWATTAQGAEGLLRSVVAVDNVRSVEREPDTQGMRRGRNVYAMEAGARDCLGVHATATQARGRPARPKDVPEGVGVIRHREETVLVAGAGEAVPVAYEEAQTGASEGPHSVAHKPPIFPDDCVAIVERRPGCAPTGVTCKTPADVWAILHERPRPMGTRSSRFSWSTYRGSSSARPCRWPLASVIG